MKHKHYDLIVAWANGAEIEARYEKATGWTDWKTEEGGFIWYIGGAEYRIKRELTDEEIMNEWYSECCPNGDLFTFARAILKKAREK